MLLRRRGGSCPARQSYLSSNVVWPTSARMAEQACGITDEVSVFSNGKTKVGKKHQFIATHTGRKAFATLLSPKGCPLEQIAIMMGHISENVPNITMTSNYICALKDKQAGAGVVQLTFYNHLFFTNYEVCNLLKFRI